MHVHMYDQYNIFINLIIVSCRAKYEGDAYDGYTQCIILLEESS